jgi:hypothetical protein
MKGTPTQVTCRGALHGYPKIHVFTRISGLLEDMSTPNHPIQHINSQCLTLQRLLLAARHQQLEYLAHLAL